VASGEIHQAFRPLFGLAAVVLALALLAFHKMPERALRTSVKTADAIAVE